jgi:hypothetical protein
VDIQYDRPAAAPLLAAAGSSGGNVLCGLMDLHLPFGQAPQFLLDLHIVGLLARILLTVINCTLIDLHLQISQHPQFGQDVD